MSSASQGRIRESWQPGRLDGTRARIWLIVRRTTATLIGLALVGCCAYLLFSLLWNPKTYLVHWTATTYGPRGGQPVQFALGDFRAFQKLLPALAQDSLSEAPKIPLTKDRLEAELSGLSDLQMRKKDTLIVYLAAHGVVQVGEPYLLCEPPRENWGDEDGQELYPVSTLLEALQKAPAGTKLLLLDAGQDSYNPRHGMALNTFPAALQRAIDEFQDPAVWVLTANAALERSHVSPSRGKSVFGHFVTEGMAGRADNDKITGNNDRSIQLDELYAYVQSNVSAWVKHATLSNASQTPLLLNCQSGQSAAPALDLLAIGRLPEPSQADSEPVATPAATAITASALTEELRPELPAGLPPRATELAGDRLRAAGAGESDSSPASAEGATRPDSGATADGATATASAASAGTDDSPAAGTNLKERAGLELVKAWEQAARLEPSDDALVPSVFAPFLWRAHVDRLLWYEHCYASDLPPDNPIWGPVAQNLQRINRSLEAYARHDAEGPADEVVDLFQEYAPRYPRGAEPNQYVSFALVEEISKHAPSRPLDAKLQKFAAEFDKLLARDGADWKDFDALFGDEEQVGRQELKKFYEFQLLERSDDEDEVVPWELHKLALHVRRLGEQVAADLLCGEGWALDTIEAADTLRWEGERLLLDRTSSDWIERAEAKLADARAKYQQARQELILVREAIRARNRLLGRVPDWIRWTHLSRRTSRESARQSTAVRELVECLADVNQALSSPGRESISNLENSHRKLQEAGKAVEENLASAADFWQLSRVLATALPAHDRRLQLRQALFKSERKLRDSFTASTSKPTAIRLQPLSPDQLSDVKQQLDLELALARLAGYDGQAISNLEQSIQGLDGANPEFWESLYEAREWLRELYAALPASIESIAASRDLRTKASRSPRLTELRKAIQHWLLLGAQHRTRIDPQVTNLVSLLNDAAWYDLLLWQSERFHRAAEDAPQVEVAFLHSAADAYRQLAKNVPGQPEIDLLAGPALSLRTTDDVISLMETNETPFSFTVQSRAADPIWLVVQYDRSRLAIEGAPIPSQEELLSKADSARRRGDASGTTYPYRPNLLGMEPTLLPASGQTPIQLNVRRLDDAQGTTKLILKAISPDTYVRREVKVVLPSRARLQFAVDAGREFWSPTKEKEGVELYPLPNREIGFAFTVANLTNVPKKLDVYFLALGSTPQQSTPINVPSGPLKPDAAKEFFHRIGPYLKLPTAFPIELPGSGEPVRIQLTAAPGQEQAIDAEANLLVPKGTPPDKFAGISLDHGLLAVFRDTDGGDVTIRRIDVRAPRPRTFLDASARYDRQSGQLQIQLKAKNPSLVPPEGLHVTADFGVGVSRQASQNAAYLKAPDYSATLEARYLPNAPQEIQTFVNVDDYPRAFIFRLSRNTSAFDIKPSLDTREVRITSPQPGTAYAPRASLPVTMEIDAPEGSLVEIGIDRTGDGFLFDDPKTTVNSDRQVHVVARRLAPDGTLTLYPGVGDFQIAVPAIGLSNLQAALLARLQSPGQPEDRWSRPVPIVLDGAGPDLLVTLRPGREIEVGTELEVIASTNSPELSGIQQVEAIIESAAAGNAEDANAPWKKAEPAADGKWIARLETDKLEPGPYGVLVRGTDKVGNSGEADPEDLKIVPKRTVRQLTEEEQKLRQANSVSGRVLYGGEPLANASVELEPASVPAVETDSRGDFRFSKVPPGKYKLKVRGLFRNHYRLAETPIEVLPLPQKPTQVTLTAK